LVLLTYHLSWLYCSMIIRLYFCIFVYVWCLNISFVSIIRVLMIFFFLEFWFVPPICYFLFLPCLWPWFIYKILPMHLWISLSDWEFILIKAWKRTINCILNISDISKDEWVIEFITSCICHFSDILDTITINVSDSSSPDWYWLILQWVIGYSIKISSYPVEQVIQILCSFNFFNICS